MRIIDRYLLGQFLRTFVICYISLTGLYIVFDAFTNLDEFFRAAEKAGGLAGLLFFHYAYRSVFFFDRTAGLLILVSAMFTVTWLQRHNELTALMAAGIPRLRAVQPVLGAAVVIVVLAALNRELVIPLFREELSRRPQDLMGDLGHEMQPVYDNQTDILIRGKSTYADRKRIHKPDFLLPPRLNDYGRILSAEDAYYLPPEGGRPGGYLFEGVDKPKDLASLPSLGLDGRLVIITPGDAHPWLKPDQCFVTSAITFDQLVSGAAMRQFSSVRQLMQELQNPSRDFGADVRVAVHARVVQPFLDLTLLLLGLPLVLGRDSRNVFVAMGLCGAIVSVFMLAVIGCQHLGAIYVLSPALAAWAPLMLFAPLATALADGMWK